MKHTPGPWQLGHLLVDPLIHLTIHDSSGWMVANCSMRNRPINESQANANLIAAAPEMLEALEIALGYIKSGWETPRGDYGGASGHVKLIELIIAKARGEQ